MPAPLRRTLIRLHPRRLQAIWRQRAHSFDPGQARSPLKPPGDRCVILAGCPRSGTSLAGAALFQPPRSVCLVEPWSGMDHPPAELFAQWRRRILQERRVAGGTLDFSALDSGRVVRVPEGSSVADATFEDDFLLGIKWPSYYRYLPMLPDTRFVVCIRHPHEILASMGALEGSRLKEGFDYDTAFNREQNTVVAQRHTDAALRRIELFDYVHERILPFLDRPNVFALRYERWFDDRRGLLSDLSDFLDTDLTDAPVSISRRPSRSSLSDEQRAQVRRHSRMAAQLGYSLD